jgi:hypothetical protein
MRELSVAVTLGTILTIRLLNDAVLTVTPKAVTVVADKSKVYGDVNPTLTATVTGAVGTDVINYTLATTAVTGSNAEPILLR